jgi:signal transduction histidine kinase/CheY-like chemotaxis protein
MNEKKQINILLIDDQAQNLLALEAILESPDYRLVKAHSGKEALRQLLIEDFAVILLDVQMPEMDGFETARLIKQRDQSKHIPIIFLTALSEDEESLFKGYSVGAVDYVFKPFKPVILKSKVSVFVELYRKGRQLWQEQEARAGAEAMQNDLSFLVNAGSLLASSLDYHQTLQRVARLAVPKFADWCVVDLIETEGLRRLAVAHVDPSKEELARELQRRYPGDPNAPTGAVNVVRTGEPEIYREVSEAMLHAASPDIDHLEILRGLGLKSVMIVPLKARDRILGVISFVSAESGRIYGEIDLFMAEELARRAALAIDNARLYQEAQKEIVERTHAEKRLGAQYAVARVLAEATTLSEGASEILRAICESLDWEVGGIWRVEGEPASLRCVEVWHLPSLDLAEFVRISRRKIFGPDEGLPGRIWARGSAVWISDVAEEPAFPRGPIASKSGLHAAVGFPLRRGAETLGVLEFFSREIREPDSDLLQLMASIGSQIGQFIERKEAEEALKRKTVEAEESSRLKSQFVSNVSHELRTPINAIIGYSALLLDEAYGRVGPEQKGPLEGVVRNANDLLNLVNDVLDLSKIEAGKLSVYPEPLPLSAMLEEVIAGMKPFLDQKSLRVRLNRVEDLPEIRSDRGKVKQIFTNLISNAIKFTPKGTITIKEKNRPEKEGVEIAIEDTGIGIRPEEIPKLFSAFHQVDADLTREYGGVGLGLRIVKDLIDLLGGEIRVESEYGKGSRFTVFLPCRFERS